ncbi:RHS repeat-associated core domain-containing protein [Streptomyces sp. NPDC057271]|uniref:RHS repeat-associated core domain-containing protein n=1 Tax=unclassified Streptomyces TaxID=2593676 RepID=UPI00362D1215
MAAPLLPTVAMAAEAPVAPVNAPTLAEAAPEGVNLAAGNGDVSQQTGDFTYAYPFTLPEGRMGFTPSLALQYSSSGAVHGGIASGWSLNTPVIKADERAGTDANVGVGAWKDAIHAVAPEGELIADSTMQVKPGARGFRAVHDQTFVRFEYLGDLTTGPAAAYWWRAMYGDGRTRYYGLRSQHPATYAPLVKETNSHGDSLVYTYSTVGRTADPVIGADPREFLPTSVSYMNSNGDQYARVVLEWQNEPAYCVGTPQDGAVPVGSLLDYRSGRALLRGTRKLQHVSTWVARENSVDALKPGDPSPGGLRRSREYALTYNDTDRCDGQTTPYRQLKAVQETAYSSARIYEPGWVTVKPPVEFTYGGSRPRTLSSDYGPTQNLDSIPLPRSVFFDAGVEPGAGEGTVETFNRLIGFARGELQTSLWLDVNRDGLLDVLRRPSNPDLSADGDAPAGGCTLEVHLNQGDGTFVRNSAAFSDFSLTSHLADVPRTSGIPADGRGELECGLNRSLSNVSGGRFGTQVMHQFRDMNGDGLPDLVSQPLVYRWDKPYASTLGIPVPQDRSTTDWYVAPEGETNSLGVDGRIQQNWYVYLNTGNAFSKTPIVQPPREPSTKVVPYRISPSGVLEGMTGPDSFNESEGTSTLDLTGDGQADILDNDGSLGSYEDDTAALAIGQQPDSPTLFRTVPGTAGTWALGDPHFNESGRASKSDDYALYEQRNGLFDVNGDGLPDQVVNESGSDTSDVYFNRGNRFGVQPGHPDLVLGKGLAARDGLLWQSRRHLSGSTRDDGELLRRQVDMDADGLLDLIIRSTSGSTHSLLQGGGAQWAKKLYFGDGGVSLSRLLTGASHKTDESMKLDSISNVDWDPSDPNSPASWTTTQIRKELAATAYPVDLNGDGLNDLVGDMDGDGKPEVRFANAKLDGRVADTDAPDRLMRTVSNGYGAKTTVSYERSPEVGRWVVSQLDVLPGFGEPTQRTQFSYIAPQRTRDAYGNWAFRGFGQVARLNPNDLNTTTDDSSSVTKFEYLLDYRGRPTRTITSRDGSAYPDGTASLGSHVVSVQDREYTLRPLPSTRAPKMDDGFPLRVVLPRKTDTYSCGTVDGESLLDCVKPGKRKTEETFYKSLSVSGVYIRDIVDKTETSFLNGQGAQETRRDKLTHASLWTDADYRLVLTDKASERQTGDTVEQTGLQGWRYDGSLSLLQQALASDGNGRTLTTRYLHHLSGPAYGQVHKVWQPEQSDQYPHGSYTTYEYDPYGLHPMETRNPAGHVTRTLTDYATRTPLVVQGPNFACENGGPSGCTFDTAVKVEATVVTADGFGRPLTTTVSPVSGGSDQVVATASYDDSAFYNSGSATAPTSATVRTLGGNGQMSETLSEYDGLGRVTRTLVQQAPHPQKETLYDYAAQGGLRAITTPNPYGLATVGYTFARDSLGRVTKLWGPDPGSATETKNSVLADATYMGLAQSSRQRVSDTSPYTEKRLEHDAGGQLVKVGERKVSGSAYSDLAFTRYTYDGNGNVAKVTDPDGVVTSMTHDWAGNRTAVTSSGKRWAYGYDRNGNLTSVTEPHPAGQSAMYTRTIAYDAMNRAVTETPAVRDLTSEEQTAFKHGVTRHFYDAAHPSLTGVDAQQQIGRLSYTTSPAATTVHRYDSLGNGAGTSQTLTETGGIPATAETLHRTVRSGATGILESSAVTSSGGHIGSTLSYQWDQAGQPYRLRARLGSKTLTVAQLSRNAAGLVNRREANPGAVVPGFASPVARYGYTPAGQARFQQVKLGSTELYLNFIGHTGNAQVSATSETLLGGTPTVTRYTYDHRHQLATAYQESGGVGYNSAFTYTDGGRLASANVGNATGAVRINPRNVTYTFDPDDPQQLKELTKPDTTTYAAYTYDDAGNTTTRTVDGEKVTQRWDGQGRLARTVRPDGSAETYYYEGPTRIAVLRTDKEGKTVEVRRAFGAVDAVYTASATPDYREQLSLDGTVGRIDGAWDDASLEYYYTSPQGHEVLAIRATDGRVMRAATYGPFGEVLSQKLEPGTAGDKYTREFNGKEYDAHSGLHYYGHRYYDPIALQWASADPKYRFEPDADLTQPRKANLYTYTANNPLAFVDPDGLDTADKVVESANQAALWVENNLIVSTSVVNNAALMAGAKYFYDTVKTPETLAAAPGAVQFALAVPGVAKAAAAVVGWTTGTAIGSGIRELTVDRMFAASQARVDDRAKTRAAYEASIYQEGIQQYADSNGLVVGNFEFQLDRQTQGAVAAAADRMVEEEAWIATGIDAVAALAVHKSAELKKSAVQKVAGNGSHIAQQSACGTGGCGGPAPEPVDASDFIAPASAVPPPAAAAAPVAPSQ